MVWRVGSRGFFERARGGRRRRSVAPREPINRATKLGGEARVLLSSNETTRGSRRHHTRPSSKNARARASTRSARGGRRRALLEQKVQIAPRTFFAPAPPSDDSGPSFGRRRLALGRVRRGASHARRAMSGDATSAPASPGWYRTPEEALRRVAEGGARGLEREGKPPESFEYKAFRTHTLGSSSSRGVRGEDAGGDAGGGCFGALCGRRPRASPAAGPPAPRAWTTRGRAPARRSWRRAEPRRVEAALAERRRRGGGARGVPRVPRARDPRRRGSRRHPRGFVPSRSGARRPDPGLVVLLLPLLRGPGRRRRAPRERARRRRANVSARPRALRVETPGGGDQSSERRDTARAVKDER